MNDSNVSEHLEGKHEQNREHRIEAVKRWVEYIESEPPEPRGPQQNAVVNDQLEAAQSVGTSATHQQYITDVAAAIIEERDGPGDDTR